MGKPLWWVWSKDYPDEGSEVAAAKSPESAARMGAKRLGLKPSEIAVRPVTADDVDDLRARLANAERAIAQAETPQSETAR